MVQNSENLANNFTPVYRGFHYMFIIWENMSVHIIALLT